MWKIVWRIHRYCSFSLRMCSSSIQQGETDYDMFLNDVLDILFKLTELYPDDFVQLVVIFFWNWHRSFTDLFSAALSMNFVLAMK